MLEDIECHATVILELATATEVDGGSMMQRLQRPRQAESWPTSGNTLHTPRELSRIGVSRTVSQLKKAPLYYSGSVACASRSASVTAAKGATTLPNDERSN